MPCSLSLQPQPPGDSNTSAIRGNSLSYTEIQNKNKQENTKQNFSFFHFGLSVFGFVFVLRLYGFFLAVGLILAKNTSDKVLLIQHSSSEGSLFRELLPPSDALGTPTQGGPPAQSGR